MLKSKKILLLTGIFCFISGVLTINAQDSGEPVSSSTNTAFFLDKKDSTTKTQTASDKKRRFEAGVHFTSLSRNGDGDRNGFGGRFGYDFATFDKGKYVATAEAELNLLTGEVFTPNLRESGRVFQGFFGAKVGRRFNKFGVFAKARPGFVQYSRGEVGALPAIIIPGLFPLRPKTNFATDIGGVLEFYPTKRLVTRFDFGDTIVRFKKQSGVLTSGRTFLIPAETKHHFQFTAGIGWRF